MSYSLTIDNKTYYFDTESVKDEAERAIKNETSDTKKQEILENQYLNKKKCATSEDGLVELNESDEVEETHMSERVEEEVTEYNINVNSDNIEQEMQQYYSSIDLDKLTEDSGLDDIINSFEKFKNKLQSLENKINGLDANNPEKIDEVMKETVFATEAFKAYASVAGVSIPDYNVAGAVTSSVVGGIAGGIAFHAAAVAATEIGLALAISGGAAGTAAGGAVAAVGGALGTAGACCSVPVAGWIAAGVIAIGVGIFCWWQAEEQKKQQEKLENLKKDVEDTKNKLLNNNSKVAEKVDDATETLADEVNKDLDGLLGVSFKFDDIKDTNGILNNMDKLINAQKKLMPYAQLGAKYGFDTSNINTLINKLGNEDNPVQQANAYIRGYASAITQAVTFNKDLVKDTESYNKFHANVKDVIDDAGSKGIDVSPLEVALQNMENANQNAEKDTATSIVSPYNIGSGYNGDYKGAELYDCTKDLLNSSDNAATTSSGVQSGSTSYDTSVGDLDDVSSSLLNEAQDVVDGYADTVENAGMDTVEDWNDVMLDGEDRLDELAEVQDKVSSAKVKNAVEAIPEKQQEIIAAEVEEFLGAASGTNDGGEVANILSQVDEKIETYGSINVDTSKLDSALETIISNQQEFVDSYAQGVTGSGAETVEDWNDVMLDAVEMLENQSPLDGRVDLSSLDSAIADIPNKQQEIISGEVDEFVSQASGTNDGGEVANILSQVDEKIETYGSINVDTSKLDSALETIISNQEEYLEKEASEALSKADNIEDINEGENLIQNLNSLISDNSSFANTSCLDNAIAKIQAKMDEILQNRENENEETDTENDSISDETIDYNASEKKLPDESGDNSGNTPIDTVVDIISENTAPSLVIEDANPDEQVNADTEILNSIPSNKDEEISQPEKVAQTPSTTESSSKEEDVSKSDEVIETSDSSKTPSDYTFVPDDTYAGIFTENQEEEQIEEIDKDNTFAQDTEPYNPDEDDIDLFKQKTV